jgi:peptidoglycan-associated lipoprotein
MNRPQHIMTAFLLAATLAGCDLSHLNHEAGDARDGSFGNATMNNSLLMMGERQATTSLAQRFASEVPSTITFAFNSSQITPQAAAVLSQQAAWIRQFPEVRFRVYGHTDEVGGLADNQALGLRRANAVVSYLSTLGISKSRLEAVVSYGKTRPLVITGGPNETNRRTVTEVSGFTGNDGRSLNGKYAAVVMREYVEGATRIHPANTEIVTKLDPTAAQ